MSSRHEAAAARYTWVSTETDIQSAGCLTIAVGKDSASAASDFGIDLDRPVPPSSAHGSAESAAGVRSMTEGDAVVSVVVEDNGFEGSREVVLRPVSKKGKAASIFWNVNGMTVFSCARRGKVLWSGELGMGEDLEDLPRRLVPFAELADNDSVDPVAAGAAMVAAFTGIELRRDMVDNVQWCAVAPHIDEPAPQNAATTSLRWDRPDLVRALAQVPPHRRRELVGAIAHAAVAQAGLTDDDIVAPLVASIGVASPGVVPAGFEPWVQKWARESDRLELQEEEAREHFGRQGPLPEELSSVRRPGWVGRVLRYACHQDDTSALFGAASAACTVFALDDHEDGFITSLTAAAYASRTEVPRLEGLPTPPTRHERAEQLEHQRQVRLRASQEAELNRRVDEWGGRYPSPRMRSNPQAWMLASRDRDMLDHLDPLDDETLSAIADWTAHRVLSDAGLLELSWVRDAMRGDADPGDLFSLLFSDPTAPETSFVKDREHWSTQAMALPALNTYTQPDAYAAACCALSAAGDGAPEQAAAIYREVRERFILPAGPLRDGASGPHPDRDRSAGGTNER